jgi:hypothetical protein
VEVTPWRFESSHPHSSTKALLCGAFCCLGVAHGPSGPQLGVGPNRGLSRHAAPPSDPPSIVIVPKVVIVMCSSGGPEIEAIARAAGADAYFNKSDPVLDVLNAVVELVAVGAGS